MTDQRARVDELLAEYRRSREQLATVHQQLAKITASASNADGSVTATVGARGTLTGLSITDEAYRRYQPAELAEQILRATAAATTAALTDAGEVLAPALPAETDPQAVLLGTGDLRPDEVRPDPPEPQVSQVAAAEDEEDFESQSWLSEGLREQR